MSSEGEHHLTEDVTLILQVHVFTDPDRSRLLISGQGIDDPSGKTSLAGQPVHDLDVARATGDCAQEPATPRRHLPGVPVSEEGLDREQRVTKPDVAVVPVSAAPTLLRQARRHRGGGQRDAQLSHQAIVSTSWESTSFGGGGESWAGNQVITGLTVVSASTVKVET